MSGATVRRVLLVLAAVLAVGLALPWLQRPVDATERAVLGTGRVLALQHDTRADALRREPALAPMVAALPLVGFATPAEPFDPAAPPDQAGLLALHETRIPGGPQVAPELVALLARLPFVAALVLTLVLTARLGSRFYGPGCGLAAAFLVALHAGLVLQGSLATPAALAAPCAALLAVALDDHGRAVAAAGRLPRSIARRTAVGVGAATGLALSASYALLPAVLAGGAWLATRRHAARVRGDGVHRGVLVRGVLILASALLVVWGVHAGLTGPAVAAGGGHPALHGLARTFGFDANAAATRLGTWTLPAPTWPRGAAHALLDAVRAPRLAGPQAAWDAGGPLLLAAAALGLVFLPALRHDRADTPALLATLGCASLATALVAAPHHAAAAALAALPPFALLACAGTVRLVRHAPTRAALLTFAVALAALDGWIVAAPWTLREEPASDAHAAGPDRAESWLLARWIGRQTTGDVHTVLGDPPGVRVTDAVVVRSHAPRDPALRPIVRGLGAGATTLLVGPWTEPAAAGGPLDELGSRPPDALLGRIRVYR